MHLPRANYPTSSTFYGDRIARTINGADDNRAAYPGEPIAYPKRDGFPPDDPPLRIGDPCQLTGGSQTLMVVDIDPDHEWKITVAWKTPCGTTEYEIDRGAVRRVA